MAREQSGAQPVFSWWAAARALRWRLRHHTAFDLELGDQVLVSSHAAPLRIFSNVV